MTPYFSVVIPLYNKEAYIKNTLTSVLQQTYINFEIIIINDGSTDKSLDIVNAMAIANTSVRIISQENQGLSAARNAGVLTAKHDYIAFLDADDLWCEDFLYTISQLIKLYPKYFVFSTPSKLTTHQNNTALNETNFKAKNIQEITSYFKLKKNIFSYSSIVIKKSVFDSIGLFDSSITYGEEEDFNIRCFSKYGLIHYLEHKAYYLFGTQDQLTTPSSGSNRIIPDYSMYLDHNNSSFLKPYIDFVYFKLVVLYKMERNFELVHFFKEKIEPRNLSLVQRLKYYMPTYLFYYCKSLFLKMM